jgi:hypothetical protein
MVFATTTKDIFQAMDNEFVPAKRPGRAPTKDYLKTTSFSPWGDNNLLPLTIQDAVSGSWQVAVCLDIVARNTYSKGLCIVETTIDENGKEAVKLVMNEEQQKFLFKTNAKKLIINGCFDYWQYGNPFTQIITDKKTAVQKKDGGKIALLRATDPSDIRLGWKDKDGYITKAYMHGEWNKMPQESEMAILNVLDEYEWEEQLRNSFDARWIMPTHNYTSGKQYYHEMPWHAALKTGIVDMSIAYPKLKKSMMENAMTIKYHVRIDEQYWSDTYGQKEWMDFTPAQRIEKKQLKYAQIDKHLTGSENAFKSIFSPKVTLNRDGTEVKFLTIEKIETDPGKNASYWEDMQANNSQIIAAFGLNAAQIGTVLSDSKSRGGGSDIRESDMAFKGQIGLHREIILEPLENAMRFNKLLSFNQKLAFRDSILTTLDVNPTGSTKIVN